jgi:hypothetical protein
MLAIMLPFRIKADVSDHASLQDQGRKGSMIDNIGLAPEGKHEN